MNLICLEHLNRLLSGKTSTPEVAHEALQNLVSFSSLLLASLSVVLLPH